MTSAPSTGTSLDSLVAGAILVGSAARARSRRVGPFEERIFRAVNQAPDEVHLPAWTVMQLGSLGAVFAVSGVLGGLRRQRTSLTTLIAGVGVWVAVKAVKPIVGRSRPDACLNGVSVRGAPQTGLGYPSGHAAVATALALIASGDEGPVVKGISMLTAGATSGARMYVGAHLPLDVVGGAAMGVLTARLAGVADGEGAG